LQQSPRNVASATPNACGALFNAYLMLVHTTIGHDFDHPRFYEFSIAEEYSFHDLEAQ
jgi:hypothetical protein